MSININKKLFRKSFVNAVQHHWHNITRCVTKPFLFIVYSSLIILPTIPHLDRLILSNRSIYKYNLCAFKKYVGIYRGVRW